MRIGAYQFEVTGNIEENYTHLKKGIEDAGKAGVSLLAFPECAVTGYPPNCIRSAADVDFDHADRILDQLQVLASKHQIFLIVGTIRRDNCRYYNSAVVLRPDGKKQAYHKRAIWGWDRDNFAEGDDQGIFETDSFKFGIRICYEVRFPEYFRELYRQKTDLNIILFYDAANKEDHDRLSMIKGHIQTRAVENVCPILTCNTCVAYQTAPTVLVDRSGRILAEVENGKEGLMVYDLKQEPLSFGEMGRKTISDALMK